MKAYKITRAARIVAQTVVTVAITLATVLGIPCLFARMQIVPAIAACSLTWLAIWLAVTLLFGRIYCSTVCPAGALMDAISFISRKKGCHYGYAVPYNRLRVSVVVITGVCALFGLTLAVSLLDPLSTFTRMVAACSRPATIGLFSLLISAATLIIIAVVANRRGRLICNTVCPVGSVLGGISRVSVYHADINTDLCTNCGRCADVCPSQCIDLGSHVVDPTRCTVCFDCMATCPDDAITYTRWRHRLTMPLLQRVGGAEISAIKADHAVKSVKHISRREFMSLGIAALSTPILARPQTDSNYIDGAVKPIAINNVVPPGCASRTDYLKRCTACGLCVAACPTGVLRPSTTQLGVKHALTPVLVFDNAYCRPDCIRCSEVCPTKALRALTELEKQDTVIGTARIIADNCLRYVNGDDCSVCVRRCPKGAVSIIEATNGHKLPSVDADSCIGCGICSTACPSKPYSAIVIEGV